MTGGWSIDERVGAASELHASWPAVEADPGDRAVALCRVTAPAVVLGSTQPGSVIDRRRAGAAGISVARRRSGGGAVLVTEDDPVWVDVWIPSGDPLWHADVARAFDWIGSAWASALGRTGLEGLSSHREGSVACTRWSQLVCFGGVGTGEVVAGDGRKIVGLAQRRNRHGAWFHGACVLRWDPAPLVDILDLPEAERSEATAALAGAVAGVADLAEEAGGSGPDASTVANWLIAALP